MGIGKYSSRRWFRQAYEVLWVGFRAIRAQAETGSSRLGTALTSICSSHGSIFGLSGRISARSLRTGSSRNAPGIDSRTLWPCASWPRSMALWTWCLNRSTRTSRETPGPASSHDESVVARMAWQACVFGFCCISSMTRSWRGRLNRDIDLGGGCLEHWVHKAVGPCSYHGPCGCRPDCSNQVRIDGQ